MPCAANRSRPPKGTGEEVPEDSLTNRTGYTEYTSRSSLASTARSNFFDNTARRNQQTARRTARNTARSRARSVSRSTARSTARTGRDFDDESVFVDTSRTDLTMQVDELEQERKKLEEMMAQIDARLMRSLSTARKTDAVKNNTITGVLPGTYRDTSGTPRPGERRK